MPDQALDKLIEIFHEMDRQALPPIQVAFSIIALMPRPDNGERPIGILSYVYRVYARLHRVDIEGWEEETRTEWDTAIRGNSAIQAALKQMLFDEMAVRSGLVASEIYIL